MYTVELTYFKSSGKYYSEGTYQTEKQHMFEIWDEVKEMKSSRTLPDLVVGSSGYHILIRVPDHPHDHPTLIVHKVEA